MKVFMKKIHFLLLSLIFCTCTRIHPMMRHLTTRAATAAAMRRAHRYQRPKQEKLAITKPKKISYVQTIAQPDPTPVGVLVKGSLFNSIAKVVIELLSA